MTWAGHTLETLCFSSKVQLPAIVAHSYLTSLLGNYIVVLIWYSRVCSVKERFRVTVKLFSCDPYVTSSSCGISNWCLHHTSLKVQLSPGPYVNGRCFVKGLPFLSVFGRKEIKVFPATFFKINFVSLFDALWKISPKSYFFSPLMEHIFWGKHIFLFWLP